MNNKTMQRDASLDVIRIVALFSVMSVHSFLHTGFYSQIVSGERMYVAVLARTMFMVCVPLFMILTGYLMNKKQISKKYYMGLEKTISIYILASLACILYKVYCEEMQYTIKKVILEILNFSAANYAWYVEMYIGLYLLIPFLNIIWHNLKTRKEKLILLMTFILLTALPGVINSHNFVLNGWWLNPASSKEYNAIIPDWWAGIYPITYYFIGCYLNEFKLKIPKLTNIVAFILAVVLIGSFNYYRSYGVVFVKGAYQNWGSLFNVIMTVLLFNLLLNINFNQLSNGIKNFLGKISNLCFGAYLVSWIFDSAYYSILNAIIPEMLERLNWYIVIVPTIFVCSLILSAILNCIQKGIVVGSKNLKSKIMCEVHNA